MKSICSLNGALALLLLLLTESLQFPGCEISSNLQCSEDSAKGAHSRQHSAPTGTGQPTLHVPLARITRSMWCPVRQAGAGSTEFVTFGFQGPPASHHTSSPPHQLFLSSCFCMQGLCSPRVSGLGPTWFRSLSELGSIWLQEKSVTEAAQRHLVQSSLKQLEEVRAELHTVKQTAR